MSTAEEAGMDPGAPRDRSGLDVARLLDGMVADGTASSDASAQSVDELHAAYVRAREGDDPVRAVELGVRLQSAYAAAEEHAHRAAVLEEVLELVPCLASPELQVVLRTKLAKALLCEHRLDDAQTALDRAHAHVEGTDLAGGPWHAFLLETAVQSLITAHVVGKRLENAVRQLLDIASRTGDDETQGRAHWLASRACAAMGDGGAAEDHLAATQRLLSTPSMPLRLWFTFCLHAATVLLDVEADLERIRSWLASAEQAADALGGQVRRSWLDVQTARFQLRCGRPSESLALLEPLLADLPALALPQCDGMHLRFLRGRALARLERWQAAAEEVRAVATEAEASGNMELAVQAWRELDRLRHAGWSGGAPGVRRGGTHEFRALLRHHRKHAGMSQQQLADLAALSRAAVRNLELGRSTQPRRETVRLLADALGLEGRARVEFEAAAGHAATPANVKQRFGAGALAPPHPLGGIVGRERETSALRRALSSGPRLVTLVGLPGVGKTRLAAEVAVTLHASADMPVLWRAASTPVRDTTDSHPDPLRRAVAAGLDVLLGDERVARLEELQRLVGRSAGLLVLDGCDARALRRDRLVALLEACPGLRGLVTAPHPLGVTGEQVVPVGPLAVPERCDWESVELVGEAPAVELLLSHARYMSPELALTGSNAPVVAELCERVDGLPAALGTVATWLRFYAPAALLAEMRADPFRYLVDGSTVGVASPLRDRLARTLAALNPLEREVVAVLASGGRDWTVADLADRGGWDQADCADVARRLLEQGVVRRVDGPEPRFRLLDVVRHLG